MKVYISADIEGVGGVTHWDETDVGKQGYETSRAHMAAEVLAACEGAREAGAREILVKDAHDTARNLTSADVPAGTQLLRGWSGHPLAMVEGLDRSFACLILVGYHAPAGSAGSPLAHSMALRLHSLVINAEPASELRLAAYSAAHVGVPLAFVSGDEETCREAQGLNPRIGTFAVKRGAGGATVSLDSERAIAGIRHGVAAALASNVSQCKITLPDGFVVEVTYRDHPQAYRASFYPAATLRGARTVTFEAPDFMEVLRFLSFVT